MKVEINPQHIIDNLKGQIAQKAEEAAMNAVAARAAAEQCEVLQTQLEDALKEIENLRATQGITVLEPPTDVPSIDEHAERGSPIQAGVLAEQ